MDKHAEIETKTARVVEMLKKSNLGGVLLGLQPNFSWITAGGSNGIDLSRDTGAGTLLIRDDGKRFVLANRIEMPRLLEEELSEDDFEPVEFAWEDEKGPSGFVVNLARSLITNGMRLGSDGGTGADVVIEGDVARCRYQLTTAEINRFRQLGHDASGAVDEVARAVAAGATEVEVARSLSNALASHRIRAVVNLVAADERIQKYRHPIPTKRTWEKILMLVVCAQRGGLIASLTRLVCRGAIPEELDRRTRAAAHVNAHLLHATRPNTTGAELYEVAARAYAEAGFEGEQHLHHQGGAAGYRTRDWVAHPASEERVMVDQAFAWNPSITGTKVEETCIVAADGIESVTRSSAWPQISVTVEGREYLAPDVLSI